MKFEVIPAAASTTVGGTQQFAAIETFSDGTTQDRTFPSAAGTPSWSTSGASALNASVGALTGNALGNIVTPAGVPVVIDVTFTFADGSPPIVATPADLTVTPAASAGPGPAGAVDLGTASTYGIMSYDAMTLSAPAKSHIYGDVGILFTSTFTGFTFDRAVPSASSPISIYVTGQTTSGPTAVTGYNGLNFGAMVTAFNDLNAAWTANNPTNNPALGPPLTPPLAASPLPAGGTFTAAGQDLTGLLLGPGIYASDTLAGTLALSNASGPLVLDAGGNPDAVFIFQASDITTTSGSVVLRNGAQANNVYWVLTQTATIGDGIAATLFQGTILAGAAVVVGVDTSVEGRVLGGASLTSGALTINGGVVTVP